MKKLPKLSQLFFVALAILAFANVSKADIYLYLPINTGVQSTYQQFGPTDTITVTSGPSNGATYLSYDWPYQLWVTYDTNQGGGIVGMVNGWEFVWVICI